MVFPIFSVQLGAALAKSLSTLLVPVGWSSFEWTCSPRSCCSSWCARKLGGHDRAGYLVAGLFAYACVDELLRLYLAFDRIPLGVAVTLEFVGPLGVAVAGSRRLLDLLWVVLAAAGILLLAPLGVLGGMDLDPMGVASRCLRDACGPATSSSPSARERFPWRDGACDRALRRDARPLSLRDSRRRLRLARPEAPPRRLRRGDTLLGHPLLAGARSLRKLPARVFGVLMSLEPAVAALAGLIVLGERLEMRAVAAVLFVTIAAAGASLFGRHDEG